MNKPRHTKRYSPFGILSLTSSAFQAFAIVLAGAAGSWPAAGFSREVGVPAIQERVALQGHVERIKRVRYSPDGAVLATASFDGTVKLWDGEKGGERFSCNVSPGSPAFDVAISPDGATIATVGGDRIVRLWDAKSGHELRRVGDCATFNGVVRELMSDPRFERFFVAFDWPWFMSRLDEYELLFAQVSFSEHRVWGENADRHFPSAAAMTAWIDQPSLVPFLRCLDGAETQSFRDETVKRMRDLTKQPGGTQFETFRRIGDEGREVERIDRNLFDSEVDLARRRWEQRVNGILTNVRSNGAFEEISPGFWLACESNWTYFAPEWVAPKYRDQHLG